jgi:hypothetical protein
MSAANLPMGSGDYAYAESCTERGAFFHPVKLLPKPSPIALAPTPNATPGPDGHVPMPWDLPKEPPIGTNAEQYANLRTMCQAIADKAYAHQPVDIEAIKECGGAVAGLRALSHETVAQPPASPGRSPLPTPIPTPAGASELGPLSSAASVGPFNDTPFSGGGDACATGDSSLPLGYLTSPSCLSFPRVALAERSGAKRAGESARCVQTKSARGIPRFAVNKRKLGGVNRFMG